MKNEWAGSKIPGLRVLNPKGTSSKKGWEVRVLQMKPRDYVMASTAPTHSLTNPE